MFLKQGPEKIEVAHHKKGIKFKMGSAVHFYNCVCQRFLHFKCLFAGNKVHAHPKLFLKVLLIPHVVRLCPSYVTGSLKS